MKKITMEENNNQESNFIFPHVKNVSPKLLADDLKPYNNHQLKKELKKVFNNIEKLTGKKIKIIRYKK